MRLLVLYREIRGGKCRLSKLLTFLCARYNNSVSTINIYNEYSDKKSIFDRLIFFVKHFLGKRFWSFYPVGDRMWYRICTKVIFLENMKPHDVSLK